MSEDKRIDFSFGGNMAPEPRILFKLPPFALQRLRECGMRACPRCGDERFLNDLQVVSVEFGLHPPEMVAESRLRPAFFTPCAACGSVVRLVFRLPRGDAGESLVQMLACIPIGDAPPDAESIVRDLLASDDGAVQPDHMVARGISSRVSRKKGGRNER